MNHIGKHSGYLSSVTVSKIGSHIEYLGRREVREVGACLGVGSASGRERMGGGSQVRA